MIITAKQARQNTDSSEDERNYKLYKSIFDKIATESLRCNSSMVSGDAYTIFEEYKKLYTHYNGNQLATGSSRTCTVTFEDFIDDSKIIFQSYGYKFTVLSNYGNSGCDAFQIEW